MSKLNVDINSSGFIGIAPDSPVNRIDQAKLDTEQAEKLQRNNVSKANSVEIAEAVIEVNDFLQNMNRNLSFSVDEDSGESIIIIKDSENEEIIRQIPSEELLVIRKKMDYLVGILFDTKV
jgi:flagellar protein FlaG